MSIHFRDLADQVMADGKIDPQEIAQLRRAAWPDGAIQPEEAEAIFLINDHAGSAAPEWIDFFVEALGEFIINGVDPKGYVSEEQAEWLIHRIDHDGRLDSLAELELLVKVLERALNVPDRLKDYALAQVEQAVLTGTGPTRDGGELSDSRVTDAECRLLRRMIFASGGDRPAAVSRREAEMLFRLKDATLGADNAPEWKRLFVQGVGNYLMGFSSHAALSESRAAELEAFMNDTRSGVGRFMGRIGRTEWDGVVTNAFGQVFGRRKPSSHAADVAAAREVTRDEDLWLQDQIDANDRVDELDKALLAFIAEEQALRR